MKNDLGVEPSTSPSNSIVTKSKGSPSWLGVLLIIFGILCLALILYKFQASKSAEEIEQLSSLHESRLSSLEASLKSELEDSRSQLSEVLEKGQKSVDEKLSSYHSELSSQIDAEKQNLDVNFSKRQHAIASSLYDDQIELRKNINAADAEIESQAAAERESLRASLAEEHESLKASLEERQEALEVNMAELKLSIQQEAPSTGLSPEQSSSSQAPTESQAEPSSQAKDPLKLGPGDVCEVDGLFRLTINSVYLTENRNKYTDERLGGSPKYVLCVNYGYENLGVQRGLIVYPDTVTDQDKRIGKSYPNVMSDYPKFLPVDSLQEEAEECFAFNKDVETVGVYFTVYDDDFNKFEAKFTVPVLPEKPDN